MVERKVQLVCNT